MSVVGLLHPGQMGAAEGAGLHERGIPVLWAGAGRSAATARRARQAGLDDVGTIGSLCERADVLLSICPPHATLDIAGAVAKQGFDGAFIDANAISPATADRIGQLVSPADFVDGGIVGLPPSQSVRTRLYLSGARAAEFATLLNGGPLEAVALPGASTAASALKMTYSAWTKGSAALLLATRAAARDHGVEDALLAEWNRSQPAVIERWKSAQHAAQTKGWRWSAEMTEIATTFTAVGQPGGFHDGAAEVYRRYERPDE